MLAMQITAANEMSKISQALDIDYKKIQPLLLYDKRLGTHNAVPGYDGQLGFGGKCLPKDSNGLRELARSYGYEPKFLSVMIDFNEEIREWHDWKEIQGATTEYNYKTI